MTDNPYSPPQSKTDIVESELALDVVKKHYRGATIAIITYGLSFLLIIIGVGKSSPILAVSAGAAFVASAISYYVFIGLLAKGNKRSPLVWVGLSFLTAPIGIIVSYFIMQEIGRKKGWR